MKDIAKYVVIVGVSSVIAFYGGVRYEQIKRHRQEVLIFANVTGDEIKRVNELFIGIEKNTLEQVINSYNISILNDIGCSMWLEYLDNYNKADLNDFYKGIQAAFDNINPGHDSDCIQRLNKSFPEIRMEH